MLKKMLLLSTLTMLFACSPKNSSSHSSSNTINSNYENLITFEPIKGGIDSSGTISLTNSSGQSLGLPLMVLDLEEGEIGKQKFVIKNNERRRSAPLNISFTEATGFSIENTCGSSLNRRSTCYLLIQMDDTSLTSGALASQTITINEVDYNFEYNITTSTQPTPEEQASSLLKITPDLATLDFGSLSIDKNNKNQVTIQVKNTSRETLPVDIISSSLVDISYTTTCGSQLARRKACSIYLILDASGKTAKSVLETFSVAGKNYDLSGILTQLSPEEIVQQELAKIEISPLNLDLGTLDNSESKEGLIKVSNISNVEASLDINSSTLSDFIILNNSCSTTLPRKQSCYITVKIDGTSVALGTKNEVLTISGESHNLYSEVIEKVVPVEESINNLNLPLLSDDAGVKIMDLASVTKIILENNNRNDKEIPFDYQSAPAELSINDNCEGNLPRRNKCIIEFTYNGADTNFSHEVIVNSTTYRIIDSSVTAPTVVACTLIDASNNGWNISNASSAGGDVTNGDISSCIISSCNSGFDFDSLNKLCVEASSVATIETFTPIENTNATSKLNTYSLGSVSGGTASSYDVYRNGDCSGVPYATNQTVPNFSGIQLTSSSGSPVNLTETFSILAKSDGATSTCYGNNVVTFDTSIPTLISDIADGASVAESFNVTGSCDYTDIKYMIDTNPNTSGKNQFEMRISSQSDGFGLSPAIGNYQSQFDSGVLKMYSTENQGTLLPLTNFFTLNDANQTCSFNFPVSISQAYYDNGGTANSYLYFRFFDRVGNKVELINAVTIGEESNPTSGKVYYLNTSGLHKIDVNLLDGTTSNYDLINTDHRDDENPNGTFLNSMAEHDGYVYYFTYKNGNQLDMSLFRVNIQTDIVQLANDFFAPTNNNGGAIGEMISCGGELFISANSDIYGFELWKYNNGSYSVYDIRRGTSGIVPKNMVCVNDTLYFLGMATSDISLTLYKVQNGVDIYPQNLAMISTEGSSNFDQMIYVENEDKLYIMSLNSSTGTPIVGTYNISTNSFSNISSLTFGESYTWMPVGIGTDGTNVYFYENGYNGAMYFGSQLKNRLFNYTQSTVEYLTDITSAVSPVPVFYNNNYLYWSDKLYNHNNASDDYPSQLNLNNKVRSNLYSSNQYYLRDFQNYGEYSMYALDSGSSTSLIRLLNTSNGQHTSIGNGSRFIMVYP